MSFDCLCIGDATLDLFLTAGSDVDEFERDGEKRASFKIGEKIPIIKMDRGMGGNAFNTCVGLARLGFKTSFMTEHGDDLIGEMIEQVLEKEGIDRVNVQTKKGVLSRQSVIFNFESDRTIFDYSFPHQYFLPHDFPKTEWVYVSSVGENFEEFLSGLAHLTREKYLKIAFTPTRAQLESNLETYEDFLSECKVVFCNVEEAGRIMNYELGIKNNEEIKKLLLGIYELGVAIVSITDGANGSYAYDGEKFYHLEAIGGKVKSATGAGDAYASGFLGAIMKGKNVAEAMKWGAIEAASVIVNVGAQNGLLNLEEMIEKLQVVGDLKLVEI